MGMIFEQSSNVVIDSLANFIRKKRGIKKGADSLRNDQDGQKSGRLLNVELADETGRIGAVFFDD